MTFDRYGGPTLSLFRIVTGLLFAQHGLAKLFGLFGGYRGEGGTVDFGTWPSWWAAVIELVCGLLVATGLFSRIAAFIASGEMAYAYFVVHQPQGLSPLENGGELAAVYCWAFLLICLLGAGPWSLDAVLQRRHGAKPAQEAGHQENVGRPV